MNDIDWLRKLRLKREENALYTQFQKSGLIDYFENALNAFHINTCITRYTRVLNAKTVIHGHCTLKIVIWH